MNSNKQVNFDKAPSVFQDYHNQQAKTTPKKMPQSQAGRLKYQTEKKYKTEALDQFCDRQEMELVAKKGLFEQSEIHIHKQILKYYPRIKGQNLKNNPSLQSNQEITAFADDQNQSHQRHMFNMTFKKNNSNPIKTQQKPSIKSEPVHQEIYWNKKRQHQVLILRPAALNPVKIQLSEDEANLLNSPKMESGSKKDFQSIIKQFARRTKQIYNTYDMSKSKSTKQKGNKVITLSKRLARLRSKSTNIIQQQQKKQQIYNQIEKMAQKCEFDLQIRCLNSQKQELCSKKQEIKKQNEDMKEKIRSLIVKQNKLNDKISTQVLVFQKENSEKAFMTTFEKPEQEKFEKTKKLHFLHDRSKSCIVSTFKGPQNKKLKIANILSKIAKFRNEQLENKRKAKLQKQSQNHSYNFEMIRCNIKGSQDIEKQRNDQNLLKIHQQYSDFDAKNGLIKSIKTYCSDKNPSKLPFMIGKAKRSSILHPDHRNI